MSIHTCGINELLVHSCHPWLGARAAGYPDTGPGFTAQHEYHEERIGRDLDMVHAFSKIGAIPFDDEEVTKWAATRDAIVVHNWKPASTWAEAAGGNTKVDARIDAAAANIKMLAPIKVMLIVHHEPDNDVSTDPDIGFVRTKGLGCGTTAQYRAMHKNIRNRFDAAGVDNVVWAVAFTNYPKWADLVPHLYPGDDLVDWVMCNGYGSLQRPNLSTNITRFRDLAVTGPQGMATKPFGVIEWGIHTHPDHAAYYRQATDILDKNTHPEVKAWVVFDSPGAHNDTGLRIGYDDTGHPDQRAADEYRQFANHAAFRCPINKKIPAPGGDNT